MNRSSLPIEDFELENLMDEDEEEEDGSICTMSDFVRLAELVPGSL